MCVKFKCRFKNLQKFTGCDSLKKTIVFYYIYEKNDKKENCAKKR